MSRVRMAVASLLMPAIVGVIYFMSAGRLDLPAAWSLLGVLAVFCIAIALTANRDLIHERVQPGPGNRDRITQPIAIVLLLVHWIVAGLDVGRFHWSPIPFNLQLAGVVGYAAAMVFLVWAMRANPFYSSAVRVQTDRGQHTIASGPYRFVRHPGYTATMLGTVAGGLALGSWLALLPLLPLAALFLRRTLVEDRMLQAELAGYSEYASRVRYRLVVGVF